MCSKKVLKAALTVFMFSIQMASTGPSNSTHLRSGVGEEAAALHTYIPQACADATGVSLH